MESRNEVEVLLAGLVVQENFSLEQILEEGNGKILFEWKMGSRGFESGQCAARVAVRKTRHPFEGIFVDRDLVSDPSRRIRQRSLHDPHEILAPERRQDDDPKPREERAVQLERR